MKLRRLGRTDCLVSPIALGTVKIGRNTGVRYPQAFVLPDDAALDRLLGTARELGINLLDTAPAYGSSEERLGRWLRGGRRQDWVLCTKCGEDFDGVQSRFDFSPAHTRASVERSLRRLGTDYLDIVLLHSNGDDLAILDDSGALEMLRQLRHEGLVRAFGISAKTLPGALRAAQCCDVAMLAYNPEDTSMAPALAACAAEGCAVLVKKAFGSGHLCTTPDGVRGCLQTIYAAPGIASVVIGTLNAQHLRENVAAALKAIDAVAGNGHDAN